MSARARVGAAQRNAAIHPDRKGSGRLALVHETQWNLPKAALWYKRAAYQGHARVQELLANAYQMNRLPAMILNLGPWLAAALLLTAASASASEVSDYDRFRLWSGCNPMHLWVGDISDDGIAAGLTKEAIEVAVRSRLRAARIYKENAGHWLSVSVNVSGNSFSITTGFNKSVLDIMTNLQFGAPTWSLMGTGSYKSGGITFILHHVSQQIDMFIDEYLRVNEDACK